VWRDTSQVWQEQDFGGEPNLEPVNLRARNRLELLEAGKGSFAIFPPPHKFFFARENEVNLGYVYYRKDTNGSFSLGVMQPEHGEGYAPWGISDPVWKRRSNTAREQVANYALYNAPPDTLQHMAVYYYLSPTDSRKTQQAAMAYTHDDVFKPVPGFKTVTGHFHLELNEMARDRGTLDLSPTWVPVFRGLGINIVYLGDFHDDSDIHDPGVKRLSEQKLYFEASRRLSDRNFLVMPEEEVNDFLGGHWYMMSPKPFYFTHAAPRPANQSFEEQDPVHEVCALVRGQNCLQRLPVRLPNVDRELIAGGHDAAPAAGGTPRCVCLQPMQHTAAVIFLIASWNCSGASICSPLRL
jgi:hypothetical protein